MEREQTIKLQELRTETEQDCNESVKAREKKLKEFFFTGPLAILLLGIVLFAVVDWLNYSKLAVTVAIFIAIAFLSLVILLFIATAKTISAVSEVSKYLICHTNKRYSQQFEIQIVDIIKEKDKEDIVEFLLKGEINLLYQFNKTDYDRIIGSESTHYTTDVESIVYYNKENIGPVPKNGSDKYRYECIELIRLPSLGQAAFSVDEIQEFGSIIKLRLHMMRIDNEWYRQYDYRNKTSRLDERVLMELEKPLDCVRVVQYRIIGQNNEFEN